MGEWDTKTELVGELIHRLGQNSEFLAAKLEETRANLDLVITTADEIVATGVMEETALITAIDGILDGLNQARKEIEWGAYPHARQTLASVDDQFAELLNTAGLAADTSN